MKLITIGLIALCVMGIAYGIALQVPSGIHTLTIRSLVTGEHLYILTEHQYAVGDTTFKLNVYGIVEEVN